MYIEYRIKTLIKSQKIAKKYCRIGNNTVFLTRHKKAPCKGGLGSHPCGQPEVQRTV